MKESNAENEKSKEKNLLNNANVNMNSGNEIIEDITK